MARRILQLTPEQSQALRPHAEKWAGIGLRTGPADPLTFEAAVRRCYEAAGLPWHDNVVWVGSPLTLALAAPLTALLLEWQRTGHIPPGAGRIGMRGGARGVLMEAWRQTLKAVHQRTERPLTREGGIGASARVRGVERAVREAVRRAVAGPDIQFGHAVREGVRGAVSRALANAAAGGPDTWVHACVPTVVDCATGQGGHEAADGQRIRESIIEAVALRSYFPGQLWVGDWNGGPVYTSFLREVCGLTLDGDLWERWVAYEETVQSACWWYPHRDFLMVSERPAEIHRELRVTSLPPERELFLLHRHAAPAMSWPDGFRIHAHHGRLVPGWVLEHPERITVAAIEAESNAEIRRVMIERYGWARYMQDCGAQVVDAVPHDHPIEGLRGARLLRKEIPGEPESVVYLEMVNSTPEADGSHRRYLERIDPKAYGGDAGRLCQAAMASRWRYRDETGALQRTFRRWQDYRPAEES